MFDALKRHLAVRTTDAAEFHYIPGPVFTQPATAAIYNTDLAKPPQRVLGGGYPIQMQFRSLQAPMVFAPKVLTQAGIGLQQGQYAVAPLTDDDGTWTENTDGTGVVQ